MLTISGWNQLIEEVKIQESGNHDLLCRAQDKKNFVVCTSKPSCSNVVDRVSLVEIIQISYQLKIDKSRNFAHLVHGSFFLSWHPTFSEKKYHIGVFESLANIVNEELKFPEFTREEPEVIVQRIYEKLKPIKQEREELKQIYQNVLRMVQKKEAKLQNLNIVKRIIYFFKSLIFGHTSANKIQECIDVEFRGSLKKLVLVIVTAVAFRNFQNLKPELTRFEFCERFIKKGEDLAMWCFNNQLTDYIDLATRYQKIWKSFESKKSK